MRNFKTLLAVAIFMIGAAFTTNAQSKVAHIASQELIEAMPGYKQAMSDLEKLQKTYQEDYNGMLKEAQGTMQRYEAEAATKTDEENAKRMQEMQETQRRIQERGMAIQQDLKKKEVELLKPVYEKARVAVQKVARAKGYDYVLDSTTGTGVILADGYDLMADVKKELGF
ncbi:hypothetical protein GCM10009117_05800 [Gangjinia marincola]|uniref:OmpH family outer membrane protein n=1 Tax=Gangjinia marincola TaxID=578463 RepID=A0ABN1MEA2_9FLAO